MKQRMEETKMRDEADYRNKDLTRENGKHPKWLIVDKRREKKLIKGQGSEDAASWYTGSKRERRTRKTQEERD
jgi:hypothetical protein